MSHLNPEEFIITRKRKKYKFALFANSSLCFEYDEWDRSWQPQVLEVGAGTGEFVVDLAARHPERRYVAIDVKADRLQKGAHMAKERGLTNVRFLRARADQLVEIFKPNSIREIWLTFSDPYPRARSAGRRLTHPTFLGVYARLLAPGGSLKIKHDNPAFFQWTLEQLVAKNWTIDEVSFKLHDSNLAEDYKLLTAYERRWLNERRTTQFVSATPPDVRGGLGKHRWVIEGIGWYGAAAILTAYLLLSTGVLAPESGWYQLLNFSGAIGVASVSLARRALQPAVINTIWALVALVALLHGLAGGVK